MQGYSAPVFAPLWFRPLPPFVVVVLTQSSDSEHKQHRAPAGENTWANVNTHPDVCRYAHTYAQV